MNQYYIYLIRDLNGNVTKVGMGHDNPSTGYYRIDESFKDAQDRIGTNNAHFKEKLLENLSKEEALAAEKYYKFTCRNTLLLE